MRRNVVVEQDEPRDPEAMVLPDEVTAAAGAVAAQGLLGCPMAYGTDADREEIARIAVRRWRSMDRRHKKPLSKDQQIEDLAKGLRQHFSFDPKLEDLTHYRCVAQAVADALEPPPGDGNRFQGDEANGGGRS